MTPLESAGKKITRMHKGEKVELTPEELRALRGRNYSDIVDMGYLEFTCDNCVDKKCCPYVFDPYNVGGDCLPSH